MFNLCVSLCRSPPTNGHQKDGAKKPKIATVTFRIPKRSSNDRESLIDSLFESTPGKEARREALKARFEKPSSKGKLDAEVRNMRAHYERVRSYYRDYEEEVQEAHDQFLAFCESRAEVLESKKRRSARRSYGEAFHEEESEPLPKSCKPSEKSTRREDSDDDGSPRPGPSSSGPTATSSSDIAVSV